METVASKSVFVAAVCLSLVIACLPVFVEADSEDYMLFVSVDDKKVTILSGNFSVRVTTEWPRVIFWHEVDPFSPSFEVSYPRMYMHNDSDRDGVFDSGEAGLTVFLDSNHVEWNLTNIVQGFSEECGEYAYFGMRSSLNAYFVGENETLVESDWANMTFWFFIAELPIEYQNSMGGYVVAGMTQLRMNFTLSINKNLTMDNLVLEQFLQGGASTSVFHLYESTAEGDTEVNKITSTVDERLLEDNCSHMFNGTASPMQKVQFAKEDGVVQAFYLWSSDALLGTCENYSAYLVNSSYFTTGNGMMLHSLLPVGNGTTEVSHVCSTGIYESGFVGGVKDWLREESVIASIMLATAVAIFVALWVWRRRLRKSQPEDSKADEE